MPHIVIETQARTADPNDPVTFEAPPGSGQVYRCVDDPPAAFLFDISYLTDPKTAGDKKLRMAYEMFEMVLAVEEHERFEKALRSSEPGTKVELAQAIELLGRLTGVYAGRPTVPSSPSSPSLTTPPGLPSTAGAPPVASTP